MVLTLGTAKHHNVGALKYKVFTIAFDASYATGGESLDPTDFGIVELVDIRIQSTSGYVFEYDYTNEKVLAYYADYNAGADGALIQVPGTTNLAAVTGVRVTILGRGSG